MFKEASGIDLLELETQLKSLIVASATPQSANISEEDLILTITSQTEAPGMHLLDEDGKVKYVKTLNREVIQMFKKSKRDLAPDEVVFHLIRSLLNFIEKNNEFDFLLADRATSTFVQVEVKSFLQEENQDGATLETNMKKLKEQFDKGDKFFQNVVAPASKLSSSWRKLNIGCFPEIANRQQLRNLGMDEETLRFVLTAEELE